MPAALPHRCLDASRLRAPAPFRAFAVRSDEPAHAWQARAPLGQLHRVALAGAGGLDGAALAALAAATRARARAPVFGDIVHAEATPADLAAAAPGVADLPGLIVRGLQATGVLAGDAAACRAQMAGPLHFLASRGAGFHNDVAGPWSRSLFWLLALQVGAVEFVLPHAGLRLGLRPGDLLLFDPVLAHGLCRPGDAGQAVADSFLGDAAAGEQQFLTGELRLADERWAALGAPWLPVEAHAARGALDLMVASFDERSGAIQRPHSLRDGLQRSTCHVDAAAWPDGAPPDSVVTAAAAGAGAAA